MASNLGPAQVTMQMQYKAPNPYESQGSPLVTLAVLGLAAWLLLTPGGQQAVANIQSYIDQKFNIGGGATSGS